MNNEHPVQLVCFDVGGVLLRICRTWAEGCEAAGIDVRHDDAQFKALRSQWYALVQQHQTGRLDIDGYAEAVSALVGRMYTPQEIETIHRAWVIEEYHGVADIIDELNAADIQTASLSNTNHAHWDGITRYPALARLGTLYASHELGLHKPEEAIYRAIEQRTGFADSRILFFDDLQENVEAARLIGWRAEQIDPLRCTASQIRSALDQHGVLAHAVSD